MEARVWRVHGFVDRRFYRRRYDAAVTIDGFGAHMRNQTDLNEFSSDLLATVRTTIEPRSLSLWLREPGRNGREPSPARERL
jgi:hypothetical protein